MKSTLNAEKFLDSDCFFIVRIEKPGEKKEK